MLALCSQRCLKVAKNSAIVVLSILIYRSLCLIFAVSAIASIRCSNTVNIKVLSETQRHSSSATAKSDKAINTSNQTGCKPGVKPNHIKLFDKVKLKVNKPEMSKIITRNCVPKHKRSERWVCTMKDNSLSG